MSVDILVQETYIRRFVSYCLKSINNAQINVYRFITKNAPQLVSISTLSHDIPDYIKVDSGMGTTFNVCGHTIIIEDDLLAAALKQLPDDSREIILRYFMLKQTEAQISLQLFKNQRTISYKKNRALKMIPKWMEG